MLTRFGKEYLCFIKNILLKLNFFSAKFFELLSKEGFEGLWMHFSGMINEIETNYKFQKNISENDSDNDQSAKQFLKRNTKDGKNILIIDQYIPRNDLDAGSSRMYNIVNILNELGHRITFITGKLILSRQHVNTLEHCGIEIINFPYFKSAENYLQAKGRHYDIVILSRRHIAANYIDLIIKHCTNAKIIFDTVDLQFLRESRRINIEKDNSGLAYIKKIKESELGTARKSDIIFVVSPTEKKRLLEENPNLKIEVVSLIYDVCIPKIAYKDRKDILFLGNFHHPPNADAVFYFIKDIFPLICMNIPQIKLNIIGSYIPKKIRKLHSNNINIIGYVKDLNSFFNNCRLNIAPLRYGAGVKGKIAQSMAHGLPTVTTEIGAEGMQLIHGKNVLFSNNPEEFSELVVDLYNNENLWNQISNNSMEHTLNNYSYEKTKNWIGNFIDNLN